MKQWIIILCLIFSDSYPAQANDVVDPIELNVSVFSLMPFGGLDASNKIVGIVPEILSRISKETGYKLNLKIVPYKRMFAELENGVSDLAIFFKTPQSNEIALPLVKVYTLHNVVLGRKGLTLKTYSDLKKHSIALPLGNYYLKNFDEDKSLKKVFVPNFETSTRLLLNYRTDLVAGPEISYYYHLRKLGHSISILGKPFHLSDVSAWLQISRRSEIISPEIQKQLQSVVENLNYDGVIEVIMNQYRR